MVEILPLLAGMVILIACSAFFSASEAALFSLRNADLRALSSGSRTEQTAAALLNDPDRLLSAVLFWNLVINIAYFAIASVAGLRLQHPGVHPTWAFTFSAASLLTLIFLSEMLPKSLAVLRARWLSTLVGVPLSLAVRVVDPIMPTLRLLNLFSRRLFWPGFRPEPYLEVADLERAIELSTSNEQIIDQEQTVLNNIVSLSELSVEECMRPRTKLVTFRPPVRLQDLKNVTPPSGYLLVTEPDTDEVASALPLHNISHFRGEHLEHIAEPVIYVPWCIAVSDVLQRLRKFGRQAAVVVNEVGETMGVITHEDILDVVLTSRSSRSERLLNRKPLHEISQGVWQLTGLTNLRHLEQLHDSDLPETHNVTVAGVLQEVLQRLPESGDRCLWGPFQFEVVSISRKGDAVVQLTIAKGDHEA